MPLYAVFGAFVPFLAMLPPSLAAVWICNRWLKARGAGTEVRSEIAALRDEVGTMRQAQAEMQERLDFAERMLAQVRGGHRELPEGPS
jgi:hypothetical protein